MVATTEIVAQYLDSGQLFRIRENYHKGLLTDEDVEMLISEMMLNLDISDETDEIVMSQAYEYVTGNEYVPDGSDI